MTTRSLQAPNAWRVTILLALANLMNFYDRTIPAIVVEPIKAEFGLNDTQIGLLSAAFTVVYALAGLFLGRLADRASRRKIMAWGLVAWSLLTAASGGAWSFASLLIFRIGVGIGEAAYAPAANSLIGDLFPGEKRSRAIAVFQLGLPVGLILAFFTTGPIVEAFGSWRAPFYLAAVPGLVIAYLLFRINEPERGAAEEHMPVGPEALRPMRSILRIPTMWWLIFSGIGMQISAYSVSTFLTPLFQRYFGFGLSNAAASAGIVLGVGGLIGLLAGGVLADRASRASRRSRLGVGAAALAVAGPLILVALTLPPDRPALFIALFALGWFLQFFYYTSAYPAVADVVEPRLRSTAMAIYFAAFYLLGGAFGPVVAGALSDHYAALGSPLTGISPEAYGLRQSLLLVVPASLLSTAAGLLAASLTVQRDHDRMKDECRGE